MKTSLGPGQGQMQRPTPERHPCLVCGIEVTQARRCVRCGRGHLCGEHARSVRGEIHCADCARKVLRGERSERAEILEASQSDRELLMDEQAAENPALEPRDESGGLDTEPLPEDDEEEDEGPELLGEGGEEYGLDPDGDPSEWPTDEDVLEEEEEGPGALPLPDLIVTEGILDGRRIFGIELPGEERGWGVAKGLRGTPSYWKAGRTMAHWQERDRHLWEIGRIIVERQRDYFESRDADEAWLKLKPLTQKEVAQQLGIHKGSLSHLLKRKVVQTPRFGLVRLSAFFGPAGKRLGMRTDVLAAQIRRLIEAGDLPVPCTAEDVRVALEAEKLVPPGRTSGEKKGIERLLRRVMREQGVSGRRERRGRQR